MTAWAGIIDIRVLNHFPGNILHSVIVQSGSSASASWEAFPLQFLHLQCEEIGKKVGEFSTAHPSSLLQLMQKNLRGLGISLGLKQFLAPVFRFGISLVTSQLVITARNVVHLNIILLLLASICLGFSLMN